VDGGGGGKRGGIGREKEKAGSGAREDAKWAKNYGSYKKVPERGKPGLPKKPLNKGPCSVGWS